MDNFLTDYIKAIENPNKVGWNGKVWTAPNLKGYDSNQRGYGIDIRYNDSAKALTKNRKGQWLTDSEATNLMNDHLNYLKGVALRKIKGFDNFSPKKQAIILGMLYRGDSVLSNVDVNEQDDTKFMNSVHNYYISKGLNERAKNSSNFFNKRQQKRNVVPNFSIPNTNYISLPDNLRVLKPIIFLKGGIFSMLSNSSAKEWGNDWKRRNQSSKVLRLWEGKEKPKRDWKKEEQERIQKQTAPLRTWRSDVADTLHGIGEGVLALHPYTAIPYYGAKVGQDFLNGNVGLHTALNASVPLFHLTPQAVGLKEATNVALEDAANLGSKTARNWRVAREINQATKNKPKYTRVPSKNLFRTQVYKGGEIIDPYSNFVTTDPLYAANYGKVTPYIFESRSVAKAKEPMMGSSDPVTMDMFIYNNTRRNPNATAIIGHDAATGEFAPSKGVEILNMNPKNLYPIRTSNSPTSLKFFERNQPFKEKQLTKHVQGDEAIKMFKEYEGEPIPKGSINGEQLRKYVAEARERYGIVGNNNITDEEIAQALYKHSKELGGNTAAVNALGEPLLLFRGDTKAYTELRNNHHESGGTEDNVLGTLFLDRTGIGEGWGPDRYLYLSNKNGLVMAPYRTGIESESFSLLKPKFKDGYLYDGFGKGYVSDKQISYPYWSYTRRPGETIQGNKIASDNFADGTVNHLNAFVVRTPSVRDITNEVVVTGGKPGTPPPFNWLIPKESRIGHDLHDVRLALNKAVVEEAKKHNQGLLKSDRGSYWRGEEHEDYDYFALPDFNVQGAKHLLPYDLRIPRNWKDKNIYRGLIPLAGGYTLYNLFNQPLQQLQYLKQGGKVIQQFKNRRK